MKLVGILLVFAVCGGAYGQAGLTTELLAAQADLALTHEFFETLMAINRGQLSSYIYRICRVVIDSHMDTYEVIYTAGNTARLEIAALEPQNDGERMCIERFQNRFELQKQRFGQALARCIGAVNNILQTWNGFANGAHSSGQSISSHVQNIGINLFARTFTFDGEDDFPAMINRELWTSITRVMDFVDQVQEFISGISLDLDNITLEFLNCDRDLEERAARDIEIELGRARACVGGGGGNQTPAPTN